VKWTESKTHVSFTEKYSKHIKVVSAIIVLFTFMIKEPLRDHAKTFADNVKTARASFDAVNRSSEQAQTLNEINKKLDKLDPQGRGAIEDSHEGRPFDVWAKDMFDSLEESSSALSQIQPLAEKLSRSTHYQDRVDQMIKDTNLLVERTRDTIEKATTTLREHPTTSAEDNLIYGRTDDVVRHLHLDIYDHGHNAGQLVGLVIQEAEHEAQVNEQRAEIYGVAADGLFVITWTLGLLIGSDKNVSGG
jgi:hypothetical protein